MNKYSSHKVKPVCCVEDEFRSQQQPEEAAQRSGGMTADTPVSFARRAG